MQLQDYLTPTTVNAMRTYIRKTERKRQGYFNQSDLVEQKNLWMQSADNREFQLMLISVGYSPEVAEGIASQYPDNN